MTWRKHTCFRCGRVAKDLEAVNGMFGISWVCGSADEDVYAACGQTHRDLNKKREESAVRLKLIFDGQLKPGQPLPEEFKETK